MRRHQVINGVTLPLICLYEVSVAYEVQRKNLLDTCFTFIFSLYIVSFSKSILL